MSESPFSQNPYAAPNAAATGRLLDRQSALFIRVLAWGLIAPIVLLATVLLAMLWAPPPPAFLAVLFLAFLVVPPLWILRPTLQQDGLKAVSTGRFLGVSAAAFGAACLGAFVYWAVAVVGYLVWELLSHGT